MVMVWLAADAVTTGDPLIDTLIKAFGGIIMFALLAVALIRGWLVTGIEYKRVVEERNEERQERLKAQEAANSALPVVLETQRLLERVASLLDKRTR